MKKLVILSSTILLLSGCGGDPEPLTNEEAMTSFEAYFPESRATGLGAYQELAQTICTNWKLAKNLDVDANEHYETASDLNTGAFSPVEYDALMSISIQWQCPELSGYALDAINDT